MESVSKSYGLSTPNAAAPVSRPRQTVGASLSDVMKRALSFFRSGGDPPDFPGAIGASDRQLALLGRNPFNGSEFDESRKAAAAIMLAQLGMQR
jgi:hypothetical protein